MLNKCDIKYILTKCQNFLDDFIINKILKINLYTRINNFNKKYVELVSFLFYIFYFTFIFFMKSSHYYVCHIHKYAHK